MKKQIIIIFGVVIGILLSSVDLPAQASREKHATKAQNNVILTSRSAVTKPFSVNVTGKGDPMLFIPGLTCSAAVWDETIARYSQNHQCHVFTLAGYAGQDAIKEGPYLDAYKNAIIKYIQDKKLERIILVGHSIGGFVAMRIATDLQQHLKKVIIVDALPFYAGTLNPNAKNGFDDEEARKTFSTFEKMDGAAFKANQLNTAKFLCADSTKWDRIANWGATSDRKTMAYSMYEMLGNDLRENIKAIQVPVLVMAAYAPIDKYPTFTKEYVLSTYKNQYQQCKTCVVKATPSSKHFIMYDAPQWFFSEIDAFIKAG